MGWQAGDDSEPGEAPGSGESLPELLAAFEHGGVWDKAAPSAELAAVLEAVAGPDGLYEGASAGAMVGIARQWLALGSYASAGLMGALRSMMRENGDGDPLLRRELGMPDGWDDSLNYELAAALAMGPVSAANLAGLAHALGARLPRIGRLLAEGVLTQAKAKLIVAIFEPLYEDEAARAEALILGQLKGKTWFQVERLAWRAAVAVAPDVAERRRRKAERRARVTVFREEGGTVGLSGRDLPAAQALAGHASVIARAKEYRDSGAFGDQTQSALDALAYTDLLNGVSAQDAIAFARAAGTEPPGTSSQDDEPPDDDEDPFGPATAPAPTAMTRAPMMMTGLTAMTTRSARSTAGTMIPGAARALITMTAARTGTAGKTTTRARSARMTMTIGGAARSRAAREEPGGAPTLPAAPAAPAPRRPPATEMAMMMHTDLTAMTAARTKAARATATRKAGRSRTGAPADRARQKAIGNCPR